ncbi:MAG: type VII toxin-antitoxin system HepT family RNase toxin [Desulfitobacteriaceae bacterium]
MVDDVVYNKVAIIERCSHRIQEEYQDNPANLENFTKQDSIILNIQRACEASIDLAMHIIAVKGLGIPETSREAFDYLGANGIIEGELAQELKAMVGFRNIAVHNYQVVDLGIVQGIIEKNIESLKRLGRVLLAGKQE